MQTIFLNKDVPSVRGNCLQACIASLLELPIEEVPHFVQDETDHDNHDDWYWLKKVQEFLKPLGKRLVPSQPVGNFAETYQLIVGQSPRNVGHGVIYQNGKLVHDPHPSNQGLALITNAYQIVEVKP